MRRAPVNFVSPAPGALRLSARARLPKIARRLAQYRARDNQALGFAGTRVDVACVGRIVQRGSVSLRYLRVISATPAATFSPLCPSTDTG